MWGRISDQRGRRPVLLTGLIGNSLSSCLFGLSKNLWWAIASRAVCGIMNGNAGVARSLVSEITDNTNKAKAFSLFGFCWGAGMIGKVYRRKRGANFFMLLIHHFLCTLN
jgi:MFS family permease